MSSPTMSESEDPSWLENTSLMAKWRSMKEEILRHKWLESEKEGRDIGWERAFVNWMAHHRVDFERQGTAAGMGAGSCNES